MAKGHLSFLSLGFFLVLAFSEIRHTCNAADACVGKLEIEVGHNCFLKTGCGPACSEYFLDGPTRCDVHHHEWAPDVYSCECCKCQAIKTVDVNNCNIHKCDERCVLDAQLRGPSECREGYDQSGKYVYRCYCCDEEKKLTAGNNTIAIA